jgi:hypothetical protein
MVTRYIGTIFLVIGGFVIGFGFGLYYMFSAIENRLANIDGQLTSRIGSMLANTIKNDIHNYMESHPPNVVPLYIIGFILLAFGVVSTYYMRSKK